MPGEAVALASVRSVSVGSASHCAGRHVICGGCSRLSSLGGRGISQALLCRARQVMAVLWPLFDCSAWDQPATVVAGTTFEGAALASLRFIGVGSFTVVAGLYARALV